MSIIIGLIGQKLAGKDTVASYLKDRYGAVAYAGGHILNEILIVLGQETSRENETGLAVALRAGFGEEVLNTAILHRLKAGKAKIGLINGIRKPKELLQAQSEGARIVYISAPPEVRYERYKFRQEKKDDGVLAYDDFLKQDAESPTEKDIPSIGEKAEFFLTNTGDLTSLYTQVDELMHTLLTVE